MKTKSRYTVNAKSDMMEQLQDWIDQTTDSIDSAESADYPNETRIDALSDRMNGLQEALDALESIDS